MIVLPHRWLVLIGLCYLTSPRMATAQPASDALSDRVRTVISKVEKSVVTLVISSSPYPNQIPADVAAGKLGGYAARPGENATLDLTTAEAAVNNQTGDGVVLSKEGLILTTHHLIDGATKIYVRTGPDRGSYADIHAADSRSDLAVLRLLEPPAGLVAATLPALKRGNPIVAKGDFAFAVAGVGGESPSVSQGMITATDRKITIPVEPTFGPGPPQPLVTAATLFQIDARTARGVSGGGVFNLSGELIGLTTALAAVAGSDQATGYAVPMDSLYRPIVSVLRDGKEVEYGFLGVSWDLGRGGMRRFGAPMPFNAPRMVDGGIMIQATTPGMPADQAGLSAGDILLAVNGHPLREQNDLQFRIAAALAGKETMLSVRRSGQNTEIVTVSLAKANNPLPWIASKRPEPVFGLRVDHMSTLLQDLVGREQNPNFINSIPRGVVVTEIQKGSPAETAFAEPNRRYVITTINGRAVTAPADFYSAARGAARVRLTVARVGDASRTIEVALP